ncbi:DUF1554 domain-containing protein [Leptospira gomenensis]|uniref:DUF1554 domain-containing protein n=1 Tax=Leptospira gomenensis TaxID=2484974 RepID=A0A5F1YKR8_9LEPT|nr:DUF1554 domain-containing protein [Leptospira gomenensis]TGK34902.1 DUF1554 domain-containing protein [Leptospira gomenensis]TGK38524.1 DUF1554 domain-containing protein [Leptospira gomenensis]TGK42047.1 DUF1554 domain-containing protein [Leptospira gomenensis]TGK56309.1 DUF1554 domain-containing protein [Leptospira gomenensis]
MLQKRLFLLFVGISFISLVSCEESKEDNTGLFALLLLSGGNTAAAVITSCEDSAFCRTFIANNGGQGFDGNLGGVTGADAKCAAEKPAAFTGTYKALIVAGAGTVRSAVPTGAVTTATDWVLYPNKEYRRQDGTTVTFTTNAQAIVTANLQNGINGGAQTYFWSGLSSPANGTDLWEEGGNCLEWTSAGAAEIGQAGNTSAVTADATPEGAFTIDTHACNSRLNLLCVEQ